MFNLYSPRQDPQSLNPGQGHKPKWHFLLKFLTGVSQSSASTATQHPSDPQGFLSCKSSDLLECYQVEEPNWFDKQTPPVGIGVSKRLRFAPLKNRHLFLHRCPRSCQLVVSWSRAQWRSKRTVQGRPKTTVGWLFYRQERYQLGRFWPKWTLTIFVMDWEMDDFQPAVLRKGIRSPQTRVNLSPASLTSLLVLTNSLMFLPRAVMLMKFHPPPCEVHSRWCGSLLKAIPTSADLLIATAETVSQGIL